MVEFLSSRHAITTRIFGQGEKRWMTYRSSSFGGSPKKNNACLLDERRAERDGMVSRKPVPFMGYIRIPSVEANRNWQKATGGRLTGFVGPVGGGNVRRSMIPVLTPHF